MKVVVAAQLPPPVHGLSAVNARVIESIGQRTFAEVTNLSPPAGTKGARKYTRRIARTLRAITALGTGMRSRRRILYMPSDGGIGIAANLLIALAGRLLGFELYVHHHSFAYVNRHSRLMEWLIRLAPKGARHIVLCDDMGASLRKRYEQAWVGSAAQIRVVSNGFMVAVGKNPQLPTSSGQITLCHLSNLTVAKGALTFIALFKHLKDAGLKVRARVGGPAAETEVREALEKAQRAYPGDFEWLGPVYGAAKTELLNSADVFIFPTTYANEAQPLVLLEALAAGLPILTTRRGCIACDHGPDVGLITDPADFVNEAAEWIRSVAEDRTLLNEFKAAARIAAMTKRDEALAQLEAVLEEMTGAKELGAREATCRAGSPA